MGHVFIPHYTYLATGMLVHTCIYLWLLFKNCKVQLTIVIWTSVKLWFVESLHKPANALIVYICYKSIVDELFTIDCWNASRWSRVTHISKLWKSKIIPFLHWYQPPATSSQQMIQSYFWKFKTIPDDVPENSSVS